MVHFAKKKIPKYLLIGIYFPALILIVFKLKIFLNFSVLEVASTLIDGCVVFQGWQKSRAMLKNIQNSILTLRFGNISHLP